MGLGGAPISLAELKAVGVVHISIGGLLVKAIFGLVRHIAARVIMQDSKFSIANIWIAGTNCVSFLFRQTNNIQLSA